MSIKGRLNRIQSKLPPLIKVEKSEQDDLYEKISVWLIKQKHEEYIDCIRKSWRISIKGVEATAQELKEIERLTERLYEIVEEYSRKELLM
ncbi:hypothetical protein [Metabacillus iocasae]|uniref:Uncharacterized protein n=1 Tax=Priestia iocasae TaxID=2291674 RepID=A0ABS2QV88_9BACI|nr:hypothetical protein [Metabacillus iocasae]MBM7702852.1 hypothetical protein [Metabacillus iocasae]